MMMMMMTISRINSSYCGVEVAVTNILSSKTSLMMMMVVVVVVVN